MSNLIGNTIRAILFKNDQPLEIDTKGDSYRVKREYIPSFLVKLWNSIEGLSLKERKVKIHSTDSSLNERISIEKRNANENKDAIDLYIKDHQQPYLDNLHEWQSIVNKYKKDPEFRQEFSKRTETIAMWLASNNGDLPGYGMTLDQLNQDYTGYSTEKLSPDLLHEATNIALRSMLDRDNIVCNIDEYTKSNSPRIYPNNARGYIPPQVSENAQNKYDAQYFDFDEANQQNRETLLSQWSVILNAEDFENIDGSTGKFRFH